MLTATAAAAVALASQAANADPKPTKDQVKSQVEELYQQAEDATNKYDAAQEQQSALQKQVDALQNQMAREQARMNKLADQFGLFASAQYRTGGIDPSMQLFLSSSPNDYLEKASALQQMSSTQAAAALAAGKTRIGDPYVFGATGPSSFDCSGFVMWSYAQAGISLPRTSYEQADAGPHVSMSELQPGDIVVMNGGEHVGLYAGNGYILHAPHTGSTVRYEALSAGYLSFDYRVRVS